MYRFFFLLIVLANMWSCSNETEPRDVDLGTDYYPIEMGKEWVYAYDSVVYNRQLRTIDTLSGYIKEVIVDQLGGDFEYPIYRLERYLRKELSDPWLINTVWSVTVEDNRLIRTEENLPFVKLLFPTKVDVEWDGNTFIDEYLNVEIKGDPIQMYINWDYTYKDKVDEMLVNGIVFQDVITVEEVDTDDGFGLRSVNAHYARGVGLIAKEMQILDCSDCSDSLPWNVKGDKGFTHSLRLISN